MNGGMVEEIARQQIKDAKPLSKLPLNMVMVKRMKMDSTRHYADALEDAADLIETFGLSPEQKRDWLGLATLTCLSSCSYARKVGQALRARASAASTRSPPTSSTLMTSIKLDLDTLEPGSLASQVLDAIETGNADELRRSRSPSVCREPTTFRSMSERDDSGSDSEQRPQGQPVP